MTKLLLIAVLLSFSTVAHSQPDARTTRNQSVAYGWREGWYKKQVKAELRRHLVIIKSFCFNLPLPWKWIILAPDEKNQ